MLMSAKSYRLTVAAVAVALSAPAGAQLIAHKDLSSAMALTMAQTAIDTCKTNGYAVSVTVVSRNGEILLQVRGDNTGPHTMENSMRKAYTSRTFRIPSGDMVQRLKDNPQLGLIHREGLRDAQVITAKFRSKSALGAALRGIYCHPPPLSP